jgi:hypothetical protein
MADFEIYEAEDDIDYWSTYDQEYGDDYEGEPCENWVEIPEDDEFDRDPGEGTCGGKVKWISNYHYYNGTYDCVRMTLECEYCGTYEVECV